MAGENYQRVYDAIQKEFDLSELDAGAIVSYLTAGRVGAHKIRNGFDKKGKQKERWSDGVSSRGLSNIRNFAEDVAEARVILDAAKKTQDSSEIERLTKQASKLKYIDYSTTHQKDLNSYLTNKSSYVSLRDKFNKSNDFDELRRIRNDTERLDNSIEEKNDLIKVIDVKMDNISKELIKLTEERREIRLAEEREEKELNRIVNRIESANDLTTLDRLDRQLSDLDIDTSEARSILEGQRKSIEVMQEMENIEINPDF